jgi:uncharacterized protein (DUF1800 family)
MKRIRWALVLSCVVLLVAPNWPLRAGDAQPPPPLATITLSNGQPRVSWTPPPAADQFKIYSTTNLAQPFLENPRGVISGYSWTEPSTSPMGFHRVQVTPLSSNALWSATILNRLTYGPTPDQIESIQAIGPAAYIEEQMAAGTIADTINTDPPLTNAPPPPPPLTNWLRVSATGTATSTNFGIYLSAAGRVYLDDVRLVTGTNADAGVNLLLNGDFEDPTLAPPWALGGSINSGATVITNSPTADGNAASGSKCLLLVASSGTTTLSSGLWQPFATATPVATQRFTLSFSYLPVQNTSNTVLTARLSGSATLGVVTLPPAPPTPPPAPPAIASTYAELTNAVAALEDFRAWHVYRAVHSPRQLHEVLVQFVENHFTTQYQKTKDWFDSNYNNAITNEAVRAALAVDFEFQENKKWRQLLLDPNCTFYDLLKVSIESPAMIIYLDTVLNSKSAANENYARELLELHTMGADNGYLQQDIVDLAKVWTGWRVAKKDISVASNPYAPPVLDVTNAPGVWVLHFATNSHNYTSTKRLFTNNLVDPRFGSFGGGQPYSLVLSNTTPLTNGMNEGYQVIQHLANLPYTMEFISVKLCQWFVHENFEFGAYDYTANPLSPEAQLVKDCMTAWDTPAADGRKGNISRVLRTIFNSDLFRGHAASQQKIKTPLEFAVSAVRALHMTYTDADNYVASTCDSDGYGIGGAQGNTSPLSRMGGMSLFNRAEPDGFSELGRVWLNTANLCERMRFVQHLLMPTSSSTKDDDYGNPGRNNTSDPARLLKLKLDVAQWNDAAAVADYFLSILYPGEGRANLDLDRTAAISFLNADEAGNPSLFATLTDPVRYDGRVRGMVAMLMCFPRFQEQ